ncbi:Protease HtpX [Buchnera aphidicola (Neophyllaphis podocarpi)]|uniref:protease HtpX n=1 Tax=Buchnera aphidicola TaxID=9 RepID=UPI00346392C6
MMRITLFILTNLSIILFLKLILIIMGIKINSIYMVMTVLFSFIGSIISLIMSKWITLKYINGKIIKIPKNEKENILINIIKKQANITKIKTPTMVIYDSSEINAFATGINKNSSIIALSTELINRMKYEEIEAVIAHEISHISNGDMITMTLLQGIMNTIVFFLSNIISQIFLTTIIQNKEESRNNKYLYFLISFIIELTFGLIASIIIMWFSRTREFRADAGSAKIVGKNKMLSVLYKMKEEKNNNIINNKLINTFLIYGKSKSFFNLFMTHPSIDKRIKALKENLYY